jgi:hypothetical protein
MNEKIFKSIIETPQEVTIIKIQTSKSNIKKIKKNPTFIIEI